MEYPNDRPTYNRIKKLFSDERSHLSGKTIPVRAVAKTQSPTTTTYQCHRLPFALTEIPIHQNAVVRAFYAGAVLDKES
jgi:hypothetical protein